MVGALQYHISKVLWSLTSLYIKKHPLREFGDQRFSKLQNHFFSTDVAADKKLISSEHARRQKYTRMSFLEVVLHYGKSD